MEQEKWLLQELEQIEKKTKDYELRALLKETKKIIAEQVKRIDQMEGELDGTLWSPRNWGT